MGYDVHVVRTEDWIDSEANPITKIEVDRLIAADPTLTWSTTDYVEMAEEDGTITRHFAIAWKGASTFWWDRSEVVCKNPSEAQILKLIEIAQALGARVVGDDGERYERGTSVFGRPKLIIHKDDG